MEKLQTMPSPSTTLHGRHLPPLEAGDHLDQATFHARYEAMPPDFRAELIVEVASSSESIDLHAKRRDYEQAGVWEYVVVVLRQRVVRWFVLQAGTYREVEADASGMFKSTVFPGLWLDVSALLQRDVRQVIATLQHGIETPEHATFVQNHCWQNPGIAPQYPVQCDVLPVLDDPDTPSHTRRYAR